MGRTTVSVLPERLLWVGLVRPINNQKPTM